MYMRIVMGLLSALGLGASMGGAAQAQTPIEIAQSPEGCHIYVLGKDLIAEGCNLHVRDTSGTTGCTGAQCNNTGNVVIGWNNTASGGQTPVATGNHNLVLGTSQRYSGYGGIVSGHSNTISGANTAAIGGAGNTASGSGSCVVAGASGEASYGNSVVIGGESNASEGWGSVVAGGWFNTASYTRASVFGGRSNESSDDETTVMGGGYNAAIGYRSTVVGGYQNEASAAYSTMLGGRERSADTDYGSVVGASTADRAAMPRNNGSNTTIAARSSYGPHHVSFGMTLPCVPDVLATGYNTGGADQTAPFIVSINSVTETGFDYHLVNPASTAQSAYTASIEYHASCH